VSSSENGPSRNPEPDDVVARAITLGIFICCRKYYVSDTHARIRFLRHDTMSSSLCDSRRGRSRSAVAVDELSSKLLDVVRGFMGSSARSPFIAIERSAGIPELKHFHSAGRSKSRHRLGLSPRRCIAEISISLSRVLRKPETPAGAHS